MPARAYVALGANLGAPLDQLRRAVDALARRSRLLARSPVYLTEPVGGPPGQQPYLNAVVVLEPPPDLAEPSELLDELLEQERRLGRVRAERWGPRLIDLDLLDLGGRTVSRPGLELPHPRLAERAFVLAPLCDVDPAWRHPVSGRSACELLAEIGSAGVRRADLGW